MGKYMLGGGDWHGNTATVTRDITTVDDTIITEYFKIYDYNKCA